MAEAAEIESVEPEGQPVEPTAQAESTEPQEQTVQDEDYFSDPAQYPPELREKFASMQADYTRKTQSVAKLRKEAEAKIRAYDQFSADPIRAMQQLAQQYGYSLTPAQAAQAIAQSQQTPQQQQDFSPQSWNEVAEWMKQQLLPEVQKQFQPFLETASGWKKSQIESVLDSEYPEWREYEQDLIGVLNKHPTMANDPEMLARAGLPKDVFESRAMQKALSKLKAQSAHAKVPSGSTTTKTPSAGPGNVKSFADAVQAAKRMLAEKGVGPPR